MKSGGFTVTATDTTPVSTRLSSEFYDVVYQPTLLYCKECYSYSYEYCTVQ